MVLAASAHDNAPGIALLDQAAEKCGMRLEKALVDLFKDEALSHGALIKRWIVEQVNGTLMLHRRLAREYDHRPDTSASRVLGLHREYESPSHLTESHLARLPGAGRVNIAELLAGLQAQHDEAIARAGELRGQSEDLTAALAETEARLADLATTRKVTSEAAPAATEPDPSEMSTAYQAIVNTFKQHPGRAFRAPEPHASACPSMRHP